MIREFERAVASTDHKIVNKIKQADKLVVEPVRRSASHRFPTMFLFLAAFGGAAVFHAVERFFEMWSLTAERPWLILLIGVAILVFTGTLHKKLK